MTRITCIGDVKINAVLFSSTAFFGDNVVIAPRSRIIAVLREVPAFAGKEGEFDSPVFSRPIPHLPVTEDLRMDIVNELPRILVDQVRVGSVSTSSVFQAGSTTVIDCETRTKQFRQLLAPASRPLNPP